MHAQDNIVPLNNRTPAVSQAVAESVVAETASLAGKYLLPLIKALFDKADTTLFEMADKAENNTQQAHYFDTMRELRIVRDDIESRFNKAITRQFETALQHAKPQHTEPAMEFDMESLSLVEDDNLEESLAIKGMVEKLRNHQSKLLDALQRRFSLLLQGFQERESDYPVSPEAICDAFHEALSIMDAELPIKLIIYKLFDLYVITNLGPFYEAVNDLMIRAKVLPELPKPWKRATQPQRPAEQSTSVEGTPHAAQAYDDVESPLLTALQTLLGGPPGNSVIPIQPGTDVNAMTGINPLPPQQLLAGLTGLQRILPVDNAAAIDSTTLRNMLASALQDDDTDGLVGFQQRESLLIDVVAMLFDFILEDDTIPDIAKAQIARLQIPMVKAALIDANFLARRDHPARQLLNRLAQASSALDSSLQQESTLLGEINRIVGVISTEFENDMGLFDRELQALDAFLEEHEREAQQVNNLISDVKSPRESEEMLRVRVDELIRIKLAMGDAPEPIRNIAGNSWRKVLLHTGRTEGVDSQAWHERGELVSKLIESVQPREGKEERNKLLRAIPGIVSVLRRGMGEAGFSEETITQTLKVIEPMHMAIVAPATGDANATNEALKQRAIENAINDMQEEMAQLDVMLEQLDSSLLDPEPIGDYIHTAIPKELIEDIVLATEEFISPDDLPDDEYITAVREIEVGQMVILHDKEDNPVRCKLSWKSELLGEYIFTNWRHKVVAERTLNGLAGDLYQGRLQLLDQAPILERALEKVLGGMRQHSSPQNDQLLDGLPA